MSLFPAYAQDVYENKIDYEDKCIASPALEAQLLASDNDEEREAPVAAASSTSSIDNDDYYCDRELDCGNLRVSTLYYPGRPQYEVQRRGAVGAGAVPAKRARRYWERAQGERALDVDGDAEAELGARTAAYRRALAERPADERLWLDFIDFQERCRDAAAALAVAGEARAALPGARRVRAALYRLRAVALPPARRCALLRDEIAAGTSPELTLELWLRLLEEVARDGSPGEAEATASAALSATRQLPCAYPHILYQYGGYLRAAGLWERLVMLLELALAMNFPPAAFPPTTSLDEAEKRLQLYEDKVITSGLPLSTVWVRVERARAAVHWRPGIADAADPQRAPLAADVASLVLPAHGRAQLLLMVQALRLAKVPVLPVAGYALQALLPAHTARGDACAASCAESLVALVRAARRLPPAHPARAPCPAEARAALAALLDPPHYFDDDAGYLCWVNSLWEACCGWARGAQRTALMCWRLRWVHSLALLLDVRDARDATEARRLRAEARAALKRWAEDSPLLYAHFARIECAVAGRERARRAALHALRAALQQRCAPHEHRLYVARVVCELCEAPPRDWAGAWASACAALDTPLPDDAQLTHAPPPGMLAEALLRCECACEELEAREEAAEEPSEEAEEAQWVRTQLPHAAEWGATRARLATPQRRAELLALATRASETTTGVSRYWEQSSCALCVSAARDQRMVTAARDLAPLHAHNALLALACGGAAVWARQAGAVSRTHTGALALVLPALLRGGAARLAARAARAARGGAGGALLWAVRVEAGAGAVLGALDALPNDKWLYVRGAACCGAEAAALHDALLERELRVHALRDELAPLAPHTQ